MGVARADLGERAGDRDPRGGQLDRLERHRLLDAVERDPELLGERGRRRAHLLGGRLLVLVAPAPVLAPCGCSPAASLCARRSRSDRGRARRIHSLSASVREARREQHRTRDPRPRTVGAGADLGALARASTSSPRAEQSRGRRRGDPGPAAIAARPATTAWPRGWSTTAEDDGGIAIELQPLRWALRLVRGRRLAQRGRAVRDALRRRPLAGRAARPVGLLVGRALGARRGRRRRPRREPCRHARARAAGGVGGRARARARRGAAAAAAPARHVRRARPGWPRATSDAVTPDHEHDEFAWWPREIDEWPAEAGRGAAADGALADGVSPSRAASAPGRSRSRA